MKNEEQDHYNTLICGATICGTGAALASPDTVLVVERSAAVGQEFIESFNPGRYEVPLPLSGYGQSFVMELRQRNLIESAFEPVHLPGLHPVLCRRLLDAGIQVLLLTEILQIRKRSAGFEIDLFNASGIRTVTADRILDTTTDRISRIPDRVQPVRRSLNAYIHTGIAGKMLPAASSPGWSLFKAVSAGSTSSSGRLPQMTIGLLQEWGY